MRKPILVLAVAAAALAPAAGAAAKPRSLHYAGKTKEGTKISFSVDHGWIRLFRTSLPTTCVSAQGGTPKVTFTDWSIPYDYRLGTTGKVDYGDPKRHYHITTRRGRGNRVSGKLQVNYSQLAYDWSVSGDGYYIQTCLATANFSLKPRGR